MRGGCQLGSSFGGFRGSIHPGGGGFFGGGGGPCAAMRVTPADSMAPATIDAMTAATDGLLMTPPASVGRHRGMKLVVKPEAFVFQDLKVWFAMAVQHHAHAPRSGEYLRVLDRHLIRDVVAIERGEALNQMQLLAVKVSGTVEPCFVVEVDVVDDERVAFPAAARVAHPPVDVAWRMLRPVGVDGACGMHVLEQHRDHVRCLKDLKRIWHV